MNLKLRIENAIRRAFHRPQRCEIRVDMDAIRQMMSELPPNEWIKTTKGVITYHSIDDE